MIPKPFFDSTTKNYTIEHGISPSASARPCSIARGERPLGAFNLPAFQRSAVWSREQAERFIESIWMNLPIASYVVNRDDRHECDYPCENWLLDGQQRWTAILHYIRGGFPVFGQHFGELTLGERRGFLNKPFACIETRNLTAEQCRDVYNRLAYGGTNH